MYPDYYLVQEVDMAIQLIAHTHSRYQVADFSVSIDKDPIRILIPAPSEAGGLSSCLKPFNNKVIGFNLNDAVKYKRLW